jgi:hypothetical protein
MMAVMGGGCATPGISSVDDPTKIVMDRAQLRWNAAIAGDFAKSYEFMAPSYRRINDFKLYRAQRAGEAALLSARVLSAQCATSESCTARVRIEFNNPVARAQQDVVATHYDERWVKEENQWWLYLN